jgi:hypothetical protein
MNMCIYTCIFIGSICEEIRLEESSVDNGPPSSVNNGKTLDLKLNEIRIILHELKEIDEGLSGEADWNESIERSEVQATNTRLEITRINSICIEYKDKITKGQNNLKTCKTDLDVLSRAKR